MPFSSSDLIAASQLQTILQVWEFEEIADAGDINYFDPYNNEHCFKGPVDYADCWMSDVAFEVYNDDDIQWYQYTGEFLHWAEHQSTCSTLKFRCTYKTFVSQHYTFVCRRSHSYDFCQANLNDCLGCLEKRCDALQM